MPLPIRVVSTNEIVVQGAPLPEAKGDAAYDVIEIDRERLQATASNRIEDALRDLLAGLVEVLADGSGAGFSIDRIAGEMPATAP